MPRAGEARGCVPRRRGRKVGVGVGGVRKELEKERMRASEKGSGPFFRDCDFAFATCVVHEMKCTWVLFDFPLQDIESVARMT